MKQTFFLILAGIKKNFLGLHPRPIVAKNREHLGKLVDEYIKKYGNKCDLNHIDVSKVKEMNGLFSNSKFNGNISQWNTGNVENMGHMFSCAEFNGDISQWNVSKVVNMDSIFSHSKFDGDISTWDVSNVINMRYMFDSAQFNGDVSKWNVSKVENMNAMFYNSILDNDLSNWKPYNVIEWGGTFINCNIVRPYWYCHDDAKDMAQIIDTYHFQKELEHELGKKVGDNSVIAKKIKI